MVIDYAKNMKILSVLYEDRMTIERLEKSTKESGAIDTSYVVIKEDVKCRISKSSLSKTYNTGTVSRTDDEMQLFTFPNVDIKEGDKVTITERLGDHANLTFSVGQIINYKQHLIAKLLIYDNKVEK